MSCWSCLPSLVRSFLNLPRSGLQADRPGRKIVSYAFVGDYVGQALEVSRQHPRSRLKEDVQQAKEDKVHPRDHLGKLQKRFRKRKFFFWVPARSQGPCRGGKDRLVSVTQYCVYHETASEPLRNRTGFRCRYHGNIYNIKRRLSVFVEQVGKSGLETPVVNYCCVTTIGMAEGLFASLGGRLPLLILYLHVPRYLPLILGQHLRSQIHNHELVTPLGLPFSLTILVDIFAHLECG